MMNRAYSVLSVRAVEDDQRVIRGMATTPTPDRMQDVVEPLGVDYKNPSPLLWQHDAKKPVGTVVFGTPTKSGVAFEARIAKVDEPGTLKDRVDEAWQSVKLGLVRAVSIGFRDLERSFIEKTGGTRFLKTEVLELSLVTIPANAEAVISTIKSIDAELLAASGNEQPTDPPGVTGKSTQPVNLRPKEATIIMSKTISEQIAALEAKRAAHAARMADIMQKGVEDGRTTEVAEQEEFDSLERELEPIDADLKRFRALERAQIANAQPVTGTNVRSVSDGSDTRAVSGYRAPVQIKQHFEKGTGLVRLFAARYLAQQEMRAPADIARERFGDMPELETVLRAGIHANNWYEKAAVVAGNTTDTSYAASLVVVQNLASEFLDVLRASTIIGRIPGLRRVPFNTQVPRALTDPTGYWVGQGDVKPLSSATFDSVSLTFHKLAGIVAITEELAKFSNPSAVETLRTMLIAALQYRMDRDFLDPSKAVSTGVSPASITNGVTPTTATGTTADAFRADFGTMMSSFLDLNMDPSGIVLVMTATQALKLGIMRNTLGQPEFPGISMAGGTFEGIPVITSQNLVATGGSPTDGYPIIAINAPAILLADEGGVSVDISREASVQMNDAPDSPETASTVMVSFWQRNYVGIKAERFITWTKGRTGAVQFIQNAKYSE